MNIPVEREKLEEVLTLLNHSSLDDSDEVNKAFNIIQDILFDNPVAGEEIDGNDAIYRDEYGRLFRILDPKKDRKCFSWLFPTALLVFPGLF